MARILLESLLKQQDDQDQGDDAWNISRAAATLTRIGGAEKQPPMLLDVPTFLKLAVLEFLLNATEDDNTQTAWTQLSRIFEFLHSPASGSAGNLPRSVAVLLRAINDHVAEKICGVIYSLAQGHEDVGASSSPLTPYPKEIIQLLLAAAEHKDEQVPKLRAAAAYDILNVVVRCSNVAESSNIIAHLLSEIIQEIDPTMQIPIISMDGREKQAKLQASLCVLLHVLIKKLSGTDQQ
ncbi:unnamed protein product [Arabis nemorensis]|uniref:Importin subunit beta-1/Transportin-1-like TPR repeats domain-containing protein n=1 Tax=Arabis nemorensis TaxID=586526 RepID=A0A565C176_9BRAS|nr:unnamed protein product [Arabis nemorensis]